jgi:hypothetical protein
VHPVVDLNIQGQFGWVQVKDLSCECSAIKKEKQSTRVPIKTTGKCIRKSEKMIRVSQQT